MCGLHGAGYEKRERSGKRRNPKTSSIVTGARAKADTTRQLFGQYQDLRGWYEEEIADDTRLLSMRELLAVAKVLAKHWLVTANLNKTDDTLGQTPPALAAIDRLATVVKTAADVIKLENSQGVISPELLDVIKRAIVDLIRRFVEPSRQDAARSFLREAVSSGAFSPGRSGDSEA